MSLFVSEFSNQETVVADDDKHTANMEERDKDRNEDKNINAGKNQTRYDQNEDNHINPDIYLIRAFLLSTPS